MGYHRPITSFNTGKKSEAVSRKYFTMTAVANHKFNNEYVEIRNS